jgi:hypothetical protein
MDSGLLALMGIFGGIGLIGLYLWRLSKAPRMRLPRDLKSAWRFRSKAGLRVVAGHIAKETHRLVTEQIEAEGKASTTSAVLCTPPGKLRLRIDVVDQGFPGVPFVAILSREGPWVELELRGSARQLFPGHRCKRSKSPHVVSLVAAGLEAMATPELQTRKGQGPWTPVSGS